MTVDVALVTFAAFPEGDVDDHLLVDALVARGASVEFVCWDDTDARWGATGMAVVRSTWDYHERLDAFLAWADYVGSITVLRNDASTIRWNAHKGYLLELEGRGVPIVPTRLVGAGEALALGAEDVVVKPAVSVGAERTTRHATQADLDAITAVDDALVQPYLREIEARGEVSIVCVEGAPCHAVRKVPAAGDFRSQEHHGADCTTIPLTEAHRAIAMAALECAPGPTLYARVDVVETDAGPLLMELELIEPTLWLRWSPSTAGILADAILATG
jgi:glutathione synthase/RimK-type ligase-like ATP-grasp enzyme